MEKAYKGQKEKKEKWKKKEQNYVTAARKSPKNVQKNRLKKSNKKIHKS